MLAVFVLTFCRIAIASAFAFSAYGKAIDIVAFRKAIAEFQLLPSGQEKAAAWAFVILEATVVLLITPAGGVLLAGFALAAVLLTLFSVTLVSALRRNRRIVCNCFGSSERRISFHDVTRNGILVLCSLAGIAALLNHRQDISTAEVVLVAPVALCFVVVVVNLADIYGTLRRPFRVD